MASGPITSWEIDGETGNSWENSGNSVRLNIFGAKITVNGDYSHETKGGVLLEKNYD